MKLLFGIDSNAIVSVVLVLGVAQAASKRSAGWLVKEST